MAWDSFDAPETQNFIRSGLMPRARATVATPWNIGGAAMKMVGGVVNIASATLPSSCGNSTSSARSWIAVSTVTVRPNTWNWGKTA